MGAQIRSVGKLYDLEKCVFYNGVSQTCRDIRHGGAFLLCLFYLTVHKYCAAGPQINGMCCKKSLLCEILYREIQGLCKGLNKGAAAGGAGFIKENRVHGVVLYLDALHILTADIKDAVHLFVKVSCRIIVSHRLHLSVIQLKGGF